MKTLAATFTALWMFAGSAVWAQSSPVVVELFTSQGCSSCPPADAMLHKLAERDDVIALALHVDYWDYIGWKDKFAVPAYTKRQRGYARANGRRMIYTPQMVINGEDDVIGAKPMEVSDLIQKHHEVSAKISLNVTRVGSKVEINAKALEATGPMSIQMVRYTPESEVKITRGENRGHTLSYANVTDGWNELAQWDGAEPLEITAEAPGDRPVVVLVQRIGYGPILAA
ncbi:MAG: DUF1223 domain-containing protein, partial [Hyphomicrobiales bacterium]